MKRLPIDNNILNVSAKLLTVLLLSVFSNHVAHAQITVSTTNPSSCSTSDGTAMVAVTGVSVPVEYSLDGVNYKPSGSFPNLAAGEYTVRVRPQGYTCIEVGTKKFTLTCCPPPATRPTFSNITHNSALVSWPAVPGAQGYVLRWGCGHLPINVRKDTTVIGTSFTLTGLLQNQTYCVWVKTICNDGQQSTYTPDGATFTTTVCPPPAIRPTFSNTTHNSTTVSWPAVPGAQGYVLRWGCGHIGNGRVDIPGITGTSYTLTGLQPNQTYCVWVKTICNDGQQSDFTPSGATFTTTSSPTSISNRTQDNAMDFLPPQAEDANAFSVIPNGVTEESSLARYHLDTEGKVAMKIIDLYGRQLKNVDLGYQKAGDHTYTLSSLGKENKGNYVLVLEQNGKVIGRKLFVPDKP